MSLCHWAVAQGGHRIAVKAAQLLPPSARDKAPTHSLRAFLISTRWLLLLGSLVLAACHGSADVDSSALGESSGVEIRRTAHGVPHIRANDFYGLGLGYGYAVAEDNICRLADFYVTVRGERSRFFGPEESFLFPGNLMETKNLDSDFFFKLYQALGTVEALMNAPPPNGPNAEARALLAGHVAGYNRYLSETGVDRLPDPTCRGAEWVQPISEIDVYRMAHALGMFAGAAASAGGIGAAVPTLGEPPLGLPGLDIGSDAEELGRWLRSPEGLRALGEWQPPQMASNAIAVGREASASGSGLLLGNPHQGWKDAALFYQVDLEVPGRYKVSGASFLGLPFVVIGSTASMAWSHTTSSAFRFVPYQLTLVDATTYLVDGQPEAMKAWPLTVDALQENGSVVTVDRTLHTTRYGPMVTNIAGLNLFVWAPPLGFALKDVNAEHFRFLNHFIEIGRVGNVRDLKRLLDDTHGIPWANTVAADADGETLYADITVIANLPDQRAIQCSSVSGAALFPLLGLPVLDGTRSDCDLDAMPGTDLQAGVMPPEEMPFQFRNDYVMNSNDSYWLSNLNAPLEDFPRILGEENTERRLRTRMGLTLIEDRLAGRDGLPGDRFDHENLKQIMFNSRHFLGEMWRDGLAAYCSSLPFALGSSGPTDVSEACPVLANWDATNNLDSPGALLFRRMSEQLLGQTVPNGTTTQMRLPGTSAFLRPFRRDDPLGTPGGLNVLRPEMQLALANVVDEFAELGMPLDVPLREVQYVERNGERIPLHGGPDRSGLFSIINVDRDPETGHYVNPRHGNTFTQVVSFGASGCPRISTNMTYGQSQNPQSPWFVDQTRMYRDKQWFDVPFCRSDIERQTRSLTVLR